jgi:hypothetical protein
MSMATGVIARGRRQHIPDDIIRDAIEANLGDIEALKNLYAVVVHANPTGNQETGLPPNVLPNEGVARLPDGAVAAASAASAPVRTLGDGVLVVPTSQNSNLFDPNKKWSEQNSSEEEKSDEMVDSSDLKPPGDIPGGKKRKEPGS